jgi:hypothetical protein
VVIDALDPFHARHCRLCDLLEVIGSKAAAEHQYAIVEFARNAV